MFYSCILFSFEYWNIESYSIKSYIFPCGFQVRTMYHWKKSSEKQANACFLFFKQTYYNTVIKKITAELKGLSHVWQYIWEIIKKTWNRNRYSFSGAKKVKGPWFEKETQISWGFVRTGICHRNLPNHICRITVAKPCESGSSGSSFLGQLELRLLPETIVNCGHKMSLSLEDGLHRQQEKLKWQNTVWDERREDRFNF